MARKTKAKVEDEAPIVRLTIGLTDMGRIRFTLATHDEQSGETLTMFADISESQASNIRDGLAEMIPEAQKILASPLGNVQTQGVA